VLVVPGSSFNVPYRNHFRVTLLPQPDVLREVFARIERVLDRTPSRTGQAHGGRIGRAFRAGDHVLTRPA
jgi:alanine-synthesizing transaminase